MTNLRIIGGAGRGRKLLAPAGTATRPTAARTRQAAFDMLLHATWGGLSFLRRAQVLDVFAGTGAYGLEALSRGAKAATFIENAPAALVALRANVVAGGAGRVVAADALAPPAGTPHDFLILDPPYGQNLVPPALAALAARGWIAPGALVLAELGADEQPDTLEILAERRHGRAQLVFSRHT